MTSQIGEYNLIAKDFDNLNLMATLYDLQRHPNNEIAAKSLQLHTFFNSDSGGDGG